MSVWRPFIQALSVVCLFHHGERKKRSRERQRESVSLCILKTPFTPPWIMVFPHGKSGVNARLTISSHYRKQNPLLNLDALKRFKSSLIGQWPCLLLLCLCVSVLSHLHRDAYVYSCIFPASIIVYLCATRTTKIHEMHEKKFESASLNAEEEKGHFQAEICFNFHEAK